MWFLWAVLGALLAGQIWSGLWIIGALLGGILGWSLGSRARQIENERFRLIDERLRRVEAQLDRLDQRPAAPDGVEPPATVPVPSVRSPAHDAGAGGHGRGRSSVCRGVGQRAAGSRRTAGSGRHRACRVRRGRAGDPATLATRTATTFARSGVGIAGEPARAGIGCCAAT
jgi:hypothetical protein